ncbi:MAG: hypothetical protein IJK89_06760 [Clostridia bacterium]|nr:hypothetical protein [Clostridia bacterium]
MKKILCVLLSALLAFACALPAFAADGAKNYVVLGDSIAQGSGLYNSDQAAYGRIVADTNGYNYANFGVNGLRSWDLIEQLKTDPVASAVAAADIVSLSIGGNDYLQQDLPKIFSDIARGDYKIINDIQNNFRGYFAEIISLLKAANPDVALFVQTLYNPQYGALRDAYGMATSRINEVITGYLAENPGAFYLVDTVPVMEGHPEYIAVDTIHPSAVGNVELARLVLQRLYEEGYGENTEPVTNAVGVDEIPFTSYIFKAIRDFFSMIVNLIKGVFGK